MNDKKTHKSCNCSVSASDSKGRFRNNNTINHVMIFYYPSVIIKFLSHLLHSIFSEVSRYSPIIQVGIKFQRD